MTAAQRDESWEDVLNQYLEGTRLRADAEDLLMQLQRTPAEREEIERSLRLADEVTAAVREPTPSAEFEATLLRTLRACPAPATMPQGWAGFAGEYVATRPAAESVEDLLDAALEGGGSIEALLAKPGRLSDADREALEALAAEPPIPAPSAGMESRLRSSLRAFMASAEGEIDETHVERLIGRRAAPDAAVKYDVRAASDEHEPPKTNDADPTKP
jgi:hypothetical protein